MGFEAFIEQAWSDHAERPQLVAERLEQARQTVQESAQIAALAHLGAHVFGERLGHWQRGIAYLETLTALPCFFAGTDVEATIVRSIAALRLAGGASEGELSTLALSERVRVVALAAAAL